MIYIGREAKKQRTYIIFKCPRHIDKGEQKMAWYHFKDCAIGCAYCCGKKKTTEDFRKEMYDKNPDVVIVGEYKSARTKIDCECAVCGNKFRMIPNALLYGQGCPECRKRFSKGERRVQEYLELNNIEYHHNHVFPDCKNKKPLLFDFFLPQYNVAIEYDGIQHFENVNFYGVAISNVDDTVARDKIKDAYCQTHDIAMIRIPYYSYNDINVILDNKLKTMRSSETVVLPMVT